MTRICLVFNNQFKIHLLQSRTFLSKKKARDMSVNLNANEYIPSRLRCHEPFRKLITGSAEKTVGRITETMNSALKRQHKCVK